MSSLSLSLKQPMSRGDRTPLILQLPRVDPQRAQVGTPMAATAGLYQARFGGTLTVGQTWLVGKNVVATGTAFTPRSEDVGRRLRYREIVQESGPEGRTITAIGLDTTVQATTSIAPPVALALADVTSVQGSGPVEADLAAAFSGDALSYATDKSWATVSGTTLTIADAVRDETLTITATNAGGSAALSLQVRITVAPPVALALADVTSVQGSGPVEADLAAAFSGDALSYATDKPWATVSGTTLTITDAVRDEILTITATNAGGSAALSLQVRITAAPVLLPAAFTDADWRPSNTGTGTSAAINITSLPADNGAPITDIEYRLDGGTWTSLGTAAAGTYTVGGLLADTDYAIELRARNAGGAGPESPIQEVYVTASSVTISGDTTDFSIIHVDDVTGLVEVTIEQPLSLAGTYTFDTADLATGPVHLVTPVTGGSQTGDTMTVTETLWAHDKADTGFATAITWWSGGAQVGTGNSFTLSAAEVQNGLQVRVTATTSSGQRTQIADLLSPLPATAPDAFAPGAWTLTDDGNGSTATLAITALPGTNGSAVTGVEYSIDAGAWTALTPLPPGTYAVGGLSGTHSIALRAVSAAGAGAADTKSVTITTGTGTGGYVAQAVQWPGATYLTRPYTPAGASRLVTMATVRMAGTARSGVLAWHTANNGGGIECWEGLSQYSLRLNLTPNTGGTRTYTSPDVGMNAKITLVATVAPEGADLRVRASCILEGASTWIMLADELIPGATQIVMNNATLFVGARPNTTNKLDGDMTERIAVAAGSTISVPDISTAAGRALFAVDGNTLTDPATLRSAVGAFLVDFNGNASRYQAGRHDGTVGDFTVNGAGVFKDV